MALEPRVARSKAELALGGHQEEKFPIVTADKSPQGVERRMSVFHKGARPVTKGLCLWPRKLSRWWPAGDLSSQTPTLCEFGGT